MKFDTFTQNTTLGLVHTHLLILGVIFFIIVLLLNKVYNFGEKKFFKSFYFTYVIGVSLTSVMLVFRGIVQINNLNISNGMISGLAGLSHIILGAGFVLFILNLKESLKEKLTQ